MRIQPVYEASCVGCNRLYVRFGGLFSRNEEVGRPLVFYIDDLYQKVYRNKVMLPVLGFVVSPSHLMTK